MKAHTVDVVDSLSLLSLKVASNVFDLSSGMHHVSIRDQIVRGRLAIRDLKNGHKECKSILIVGAGIAGMSAALEAVARGIEKVVVVETAAEPFSLFAGLTKRHVGPFMYEWPSPMFAEQSYPSHGDTPWTCSSNTHLAWSIKHPVCADEFAKILVGEFKQSMLALQAKGRRPPIICVNFASERVRIVEFVKKFARNEAARALARLQDRKPGPALTFHYQQQETWPAGIRKSGSIQPEYVFLAAGMGVETVRLVKNDAVGKPYAGPNHDGPGFWTNQDTLLDPATAERRVAIFGGGDGALQDVLRALTGHAHPLLFLAFLEKSPKIKDALARVGADLLTMERQSRLSGNWKAKHPWYGDIDAICADMAKRLAKNVRIVRRVGQGLRRGSGSVALFVRDGCFDKAYLLNRFLVHLLIACSNAQRTMWKGRMSFRAYFKHAAVGYVKTATGKHLVTIQSRANTPLTFDHECEIIGVRYGIERNTVPGAQMIQVSPKRSNQRTTLARVELPFVAET